jgi:hypothetical protein
MPFDPDILISISCVRRGTDLIGFLSVSERPHDFSGRLFCVGSVGLAWPIETVPTNAGTVFEPPDDSEHVSTLIMRQKQPYANFTAALGEGTFGSGVFGEGVFG